MIVEQVVCDEPTCRTVEPMVASVVPDHWISFDGRQFCSGECFAAWGMGAGYVA